jgi:HPt (histidine-containing phosphotransfer) domain-containing protein
MTVQGPYPSYPIDSAVLEQFVAETSTEAVAAFVASFVDLAPERLRRIRRACATRETEQAVIALLSLRSSAAMIGADRLVGATSALLRVLRSAPRPWAAIDDAVEHQVGAAVDEVLLALTGRAGWSG